MPEKARGTAEYEYCMLVLALEDWTSKASPSALTTLWFPSSPPSMIHPDPDFNMFPWGSSSPEGNQEPGSPPPIYLFTTWHRIEWSSYIGTTNRFTYCQGITHAALVLVCFSAEHTFRSYFIQDRELLTWCVPE